MNKKVLNIINVAKAGWSTMFTTIFKELFFAPESMIITRRVIKAKGRFQDCQR